MGEIAGGFATSHVLFQPEGVEAAAERIVTGMMRMRAQVAALRPDALVIVTSDHMNNFTLKHQVTLAVGVADEYVPLGDMGLPQTVFCGCRLLGEAFAREAAAAGFDLVQVEEVRPDHGMMITKLIADPDSSMPAVLVYINSNMPLPPSPGRCYALGGALRAAVQAVGPPLDSFVFPVPTVGGSTVSNSALTPETADTITVGAVFSSRSGNELFSDLSLAVDYYKIDIEEAINFIPGVTALRNCFNQIGSNPTFDPNSVFCQPITRSPGGIITGLNTAPVNSGGVKTDGIDVQLDWRVDLGAGSVQLNVVGTRLNSFEVANLAISPFLEFAGTLGTATGPLAKWKSNTTLAYTRDSATLGLRWNYLGSMRSATSVTTPNNVRPGVAAYDAFDFFARWGITDAIELRAGVTNLTDEDPLDVDGNPGQTNPSVFDPLGRRYNLTVTARF